MSSIPSSTVANSLASSTGLNSGLDIDGIITKLMAIENQPIADIKNRQTAIKQKMSAYSSIQGKVNDVLVAVKKLTTRNFDGTTLFDALKATSSNENIVTASATAAASSQSLTLEVKSLPTQTRATSTGLVGKFDNNTVLGDLGITAGSFTMYVNGAAHTYSVTETQTIGDLFTAINADFPAPGSPTVPEVTASIVDGKVSFAYSGGAATDIKFGSGSDTSNILAKLHLNTAVDNDTDTIAASLVTTGFNTGLTLSDADDYLNTPITDGNFTINGVSFDTTGKSLSTLMQEINASGAKVTASFNTASNSFTLTSKDSGSALINLADGTGNFLTAMGLVNGSDTTSSQTVGKNAEFVLNGVTMYSTSTTVDENVTGLTGVTLSLKQATPGSTTQITIQKDTAGIVAAVKDVITKYNAAVSLIDQQTDAKNSGVLAGDSRIKDLRNSLRTLFTSQVSGLGSSGYDSLQLVGITTGAIGTGVSSGGSPQLQLDESKLTAALNSDPAIIRKLFIGQNLTDTLDGSSGDDNMEGAFTKIFHLLSDQVYTDGSGGYGALYAGTNETNKGLFASYQASQQKIIDSLNDSIQRTQDRLALKEDRLRKQFTAMDQLVGQYQQQGSALNSLISSLSSK